MKRDLSPSYSRWLLRHRWAVLLSTVAFALIAASGMRYLTFSTNYRMFFSKENPQLKAYDALQAIYTRTDNVFFTVRPKDGDVFTPSVLRAIETLTDSAWRLPHAIRVDSVTNFQHTRAIGDDLTVESLVPDASALSEADLQRVRSIAISEPSLVNRLISPDGATTGVNVTIHLPGLSNAETPTVVARARELAESVRASHPDLHVAVTGIVALSNAFREAAAHDVRTLFPLMYAVIVVVMIALLRSLSATVAIIAVISLATVTAMGLAGWAGSQLSSPTAMAPTIILTLAVADSVHLLVSMFDGMRRGLAKTEAIVESLRINMQPVFLTSVTTLIGFLSLNFSEAPPFRQFGNITALGIAIAWAYSIVLLPPLMAVLPLRVAASSSRDVPHMQRLANSVIAWRRTIVWSSAALFLAFGALTTRLEIDDQFVGFFGPSIQFRKDTDFTTEHLTGIYQIDYSLGADGPGGVNEPGYFSDVESFEEWFKRQAGVLHVSSITDVMKRLNKNMHGDADDAYRLPENRALAAQYLLLYEMSLPYGLDLNNQVNLDKSATRFQVTLESMSSSAFRALKEHAERWLENNTPDYMHAEGTGPTTIFTYLNYSNMRSMFLGTPIALLLIGLCLCLSLRSLKMGALSMIPNVTPPLVTFGFWALLVGRAGLAASFVTAVALGIIVDDTVHFLTKYLRTRREEGINAADAVRRTFSTVGPALCITTLILIAGFGVLTFSAFELNATLGQLTAITMAAALATDLLLLPALLIVTDAGSPSQSPGDASASLQR